MFLMMKPGRGAMPSKRTRIWPRRAGRHALPQLIGAACFLCLCLAAFAQQPTCSPPQQTASKTGRADHELVVRSFERHDPNNNCASLEPPRVDLDLPPSHGVVCLRRAQFVIRWVCNTNRSAYCVGRKASGVSLVYRPRHAYTGADELRYTVHLPTGPLTFSVSLTIEQDDPPSPGAMPADISAPAGDMPQSSGPIPLCPALVS
jgi:hypothetical protein